MLKGINRLEGSKRIIELIVCQLFSKFFHLFYFVHLRTVHERQQSSGLRGLLSRIISIEGQHSFINDS